MKKKSLPFVILASYDQFFGMLTSDIYGTYAMQKFLGEEWQMEGA